ncbi:N-methyl-L-tryptophan oxidase [Pseudoclavibacter soli]|uniref:N-methyl-L-tryptophan oxidase n=1 Tax=Pseudoclavibacter soli TaxID=452623 RepID=UPI000415AC51|nr:N-methyl-L-tryptophan oxidase [Pseudoclavibacter soli]
MHADVAVVGLGTVGALTLAELSRQPDLTVVGIEQFGPVHAHGSFTGESRVFRTAVHEGDRYVPALLQARRLWKQLGAEVGRQLLLETGVLSIGPQGSDAIETTRREAAGFDLPHEALSHDELAERFPQHDLDPDDVGFVDLLGGGLRPELTVLSGLEIAQAHGAQLLTRSPVLAIEHRADGVAIVMGEETVIADRVVVCTGAWSGELLGELDGMIRVTPLALTWFAPHHIEQFSPERFPVFLRDRGNEHLFGVPTLDGFSIKASAGDLWGDFARVADAPTEVDLPSLERIAKAAAWFMPDLNPEPVRASMHFDGYASDRVPIIDASADGRMVIVAGLSGHGFKFAPLFAQWAAQLSLGDEPELYDAATYALAAHRKLEL